jgi:hypothetical protein
MRYFGNIFYHLGDAFSPQVKARMQRSGAGTFDLSATCRRGSAVRPLWPGDCLRKKWGRPGLLLPRTSPAPALFRKAIAVRQVAWLLILLGAISWLACILPGPEPVHSHVPDALGSWRRTATGWEENTTWTKPVASDLPGLHPLAAAALLLAGAVGGSSLVGSTVRPPFPEIPPTTHRKPVRSRRKHSPGQGRFCPQCKRSFQ